MSLKVSTPLFNDAEPEPPEATTLSQLLDQIGGCRIYPLFITSTMAFLWTLCALSALSPAFMAPSTPCIENCTFYTLQDEFEMNKTLIDPAELTSSVYFFGNFLVGQVYATLADRFGRRPIVIGSLLCTGIAGIIGTVAPNFAFLLVARFFQGSFFTPLTMVNWVLCGESLPQKAHGVVSMVFGTFWVFGYCVLAPLSLLFPTWRQLQLVTSAPNVVFAVVLFFTLPESIAYTTQKKSRDKVEHWIKKNEQLSGDRLRYDLDKIVESAQAEGESHLTLRELIGSVLRDRLIAVHTLIETLIWMFDFMAYCSLSLTSTSVGSVDSTFSFLFSGLVELPAYTLLPIVLQWTDRKTAVTLCHVIGSAALVAMFFLEPDSPWHLPVWLTAKFAAACCYILCYVCGSELFPAFCRSCCMGVCATFCNLGAIAAPYVFALDSIYKNSQFLLLATTSSICAGLVQFLPEPKQP